MTSGVRALLPFIASALILFPISAFSEDAEISVETEDTAGNSPRNNSPSTGGIKSGQRSWSLHYFGIYFGPSLQKESSQPILDTRNFLTINNTLAQDTVLGFTAGWSWQTLPLQQATARDPLIKIARNNLIRDEHFSWYGDFRVHFPITADSRERDLWVGLQTFHFLNWDFDHGGAGLSLSARFNQFGGEGRGDQWELYSAPNVYWSVLPRVALNLLLEWAAGQPFGEKSGLLLSNGLDLEPGLTWSLSEGLLLNPFFSIPLDDTSRELSGGPSLGMTFSWQLL